MTDLDSINFDFTDYDGDTRNTPSLPSGYCPVKGGLKRCEYWGHRHTRRSQPLDYGDETAHRPGDMGAGLLQLQPRKVCEWDLCRLQGSTVVSAIWVRTASVPWPELSHA